MKKKNIVFSGGHHNSALKIANELKDLGNTVIWFGHKYSMSGVSNVSQEYKDVIDAGITFIDLKSGKVHRGSIWQWFKLLYAIIFCLYYYLFIQKPDVIIVFGGYLAVPVALAGWILKIPIFAHEQTMAMGKANRLLLGIVTKMYLAWPIEKYKNNPKCQVIGLPLIKRNKQLELSQSVSAFIKPHNPLLLVSGGKQGSHFVNCLIEECLEDLLKNWQIIHITGENSITHDFERLLTKRQTLAEKLKQNYLVLSYAHDFLAILHRSNLIIGRSGAHTVYEVIHFRKKMVAIPLPASSHDEQLHNARLLESLGLGLILEQHQANPQTLKLAIKHIQSRKINQRTLENKIKILQSTKDPIKVIVKDVGKYL